MSKKFAEHSQLNLSQVNKDVLKKWDRNDVSPEYDRTCKDVLLFVFL